MKHKVRSPEFLTPVKPTVQVVDLTQDSKSNPIIS